MNDNYLKNVYLKDIEISENFKNLLISNLNFDQLIAVINLKGYFLIIAGAGSGKTRVIIYRTILLLKLQIPEKNILVLTFTRKATNEIKNRLNSFFPNSNVQIETFHSLAYKLLKKFSSNKTFKLLTPEDFFILSKNCSSYKKISKLLKKDALVKLFNKTESEILNDFYFKKLNKTSQADFIFFLNELNSLKVKDNIYSFSDLLTELLKLLELNLIPINFEYIMIDEYQDTDIIQVKILKLLAKKNNLMAVGDDFQSIYSFKGALIENILNFSKDFSSVKTFILKENYRSSPEILNLSNEFSKSLKQCFRKKLITKNSSIKKPTLSIFKSHSDEIIYIYNKIKQILEENKLASITILFRNFIYMKEFIKYFKELKLNFSIISNPFLENIFKDESFTNNSNINLLTIHSSKGLEWDYVFIPLLLDGIIPSCIGENINLEEEKRLFYVALTRAKKEIFLSYSLNFYNEYGFFSIPSPFIDNINSNFFNIKRG
ncbi:MULTISPECIES: ATP-dependent helicase [Cetobacterium]|uniref:DNA 3'-5' helicase n=1 Tax=Candidatus Cetobacterium colombiensis TaxID=3073100 RepID=A0ABU4WB02_9FUSO|nr:ATP-dependent helicase [Candidatus Cetobacterium colombiensis]MDX8335736.1 ATP-dependent helicase [Candidatus Cetobacterium colombiensis]